METVKLISIIQSRITNDDKINSWLFQKAQDVMDKASKHLEYVTRVMPEFDKHDASHSEKVLENIELLLGESSEKLSSFELFFIIISAYLHDCAMALSDYEKAVLELTEGTEDKFVKENSIKNDGKKCLSASESKQFIKDFKASIYQDFNGEIQKWMFVPRTENELIDYFSKLLRDYQAFRNGYYEEIKDCKDEDFEKKNISLRTEYIRQTHHTRIADYLEHSGDTIFKDFPISGMGNKIAIDIAAVCKAHGEEPKFLDTLKTKVKYCGNETTNLQYISMLLRIGDIVHYDYERAPTELRSLHKFESDYSHWIWRIKADNGINYDISEGLISYNGFFCAPEDYYEFSNYLDGVDRELLLFLRMKSAWEKKYDVAINGRVNREGVECDETIFKPVIGLKFTLNQKRIMDLLMGVGLYKDKYACIRELYQNALDACRCQIAKEKAIGRTLKGKIEFGIDEENGKKYLYCLDNGKGMSELIIENYLLKIGNSYYKSTEFYQEQAKTGFSFTPTSQFGIGILSCFMIGHKLEIVTKEENGEYIACAINGPLEYFYYKTPSDIDKELIPSSGTIVKVFLYEENTQKLNSIDEYNRPYHPFSWLDIDDDVFDNVELIEKKFNELEDGVKCELNEFINKKREWKKSIYTIIDRFIGIIPEQIEVCVKGDNGRKEKILDKPIVVSAENLTDKDLALVKQYYKIMDLTKIRKNMFDYFEEKINSYKHAVIEVKQKGIQYKTIISFPIKELFFELNEKGLFITNNSKVCVDGISLSNYSFEYPSASYQLAHFGIVNFYGNNLPQLSVDRTTIISDKTTKYDEVYKDIIRKVIKYAIQETKNHIYFYDITRGSNLYDMVWEKVFKQIDYASSYFYESLSEGEFDDIIWSNLLAFLEDNISIGVFLNKENVIVKNFDFRELNDVSRIILQYKLSLASNIEVNDNYVNIIFNTSNRRKTEKNEIDNDYLFLICANSYGKTFDEYDLISYLYPIIPDYLYKFYKGIILNEHCKIDTNIFHYWNFDVSNADFHLSKEFSDDIFEYESDSYESPIEDFLPEYNPVLLPPNTLLVFTIYISPGKNKSLLHHKNPILDKAAKEGWSMIAIEEKKEDEYLRPKIYAKAGKCTRKELVELLPESFWKERSEYTYIFPNGKKVKDYMSNSSNSNQ